MDAKQTLGKFDTWIKLDTIGELHITGEIDLNVVQSDMLRKTSFSSVDDAKSQSSASLNSQPRRKLATLFGIKK